MPVTFSALLIAFCITLFLLSGFYVVGGALSAAFGQRKLYSSWQAVFFYLLSGVVATVSLYALFRASGRTVLLPIPFLLPFVIRSFNQKLADNETQASARSWEPFLFLIAAVIAYLFWYVVKFLPAEKGTIAFS